MWIRNAPKLHIAKVIGVLREAVLHVEKELIDANRLAHRGDIFHLDLEEVDKALIDDTFDLMQLVRPRMMAHQRAVKATECPLLIDSRCRILRPDPPNRDDVEEGTLLGTAVSPGTAMGRVRVMRSPDERFESGEILAATVTSPAWTPLFSGASAVVLQIGGALQHGALCAREYGLPAVSNIDVHNVLKTGMLVEVNGNTGTIKIIE
jgi:pyruvate,water dikinase